MTDRIVKVILRGEVGHLVAATGTAAKAVGGLADRMTALEKDAEKARRGMTAIGDSAGKLGLIAAGSLGLVTKAAMDWESAWAGVTKTVDGSNARMADLEDQLRGLATTLPATHDEIAGVAEAAGQLGVERDSIVAFTRTMIDLGETTNLSAQDAATAIAQMANVMGTSGDDVDNLGSALVALGNDGASTERQIIEMAQRISGAGAQIGLAESDILAIANAAASMGIEVEAGGTAISRVFTDMAKATAQGGDRLELFAKVAGVSADQFATAFRDTPAQAFALFTEGLDEINRAGGDVFTTLDQLKLSDVRVSQALLGMAASGDLLTDSLQLGARAWEDNTALAVEAAKRYETSAAQTQIAWNNIKDAAIDFGDVALPVLAAGAEKAAAFAQAMGGLPDPVKETGVALAGITAVTGGTLWFGSKVIGGIADTRQALDDLGAMSGRTGTALRGVSQAAGVAAAGLGALALVDALQGGFEDYTIGVESMTGALLDLANGATAATAGTNLDGLSDSIDRLANPNMAQAFQDNVTDVLGGIGGGSELKEARAQIEALDASLANLVNTGNPQVAKAALDNLATTYGLSKSEVQQLLGLMPQYKEALDGQKNAADLAAFSTDDLTGSVGRNTTATDTNTDAIDKNIDAMRRRKAAAVGALDAESAYQAALDAGKEREEQRADLQERITDAITQGARERRDLRRQLSESGGDAVEQVADLQRQLADAKSPEARRGIQERIADARSGAGEAQRRIQEQITESYRRQREAVADLKDQLADYAKTLDQDTVAGRENMAVLSGMASTWNDLTAKQQDAKGAYGEARRALIDQARQYGATRDEAVKYANDLLEVPERVVTRVELQKQKAQEELDRFREAFYGLDGEVAKATLKVRLDQMEGKLDRFGGVPGAATGGRIRGPGTSTSDSIPTLLSDGEYVVRTRAVDYYGQEFFDSVNAMRYAGGGLVHQGPPAAQTRNSTSYSTTNYYGTQGPLAVMGQLDITALGQVIRGEIQAQIAVQSAAAAGAARHDRFAGSIGGAGGAFR